ncbi:CDP-alcohol phosphatidyltransferase family protein [Lipingzhangella sp. LS1_29]|uniref:Phosphatidylinositol phosphate synthase n=1 Tax=Lipingzhangella rawalii TaxID=2055835 RepID=A0ABU2H7M7_9ACTN|nr:CDP-alcohol phosphatidyltransferase family protein [Lipingzhangella rawalii]MDS1271313.1 CDP-alcohol phosphatidyltransferase family protein [Lipingzhangella rawalii]
MLRNLRPVVASTLDPVGRALARVGLTPNAVTVLGSVGVLTSALVLYPRGELLLGTLLVTFFTLFDMLDGAVARARTRDNEFGAFLDSFMDRLSDAGILCGLLLWFIGGGNSPVLTLVTLFCLVAGFGVSYVKARAEGLGVRCDVGIAERTERLVIVLTAAGLEGMGVPYALPTGLWLLALLSVVTIGQRLLETHNRLGGAERRPTSH